MGTHQHRNGGARISTTSRGVAEPRAASTSTSRAPLSAGFVTSFLVVLFGAALATAAPAAAIDDPSRPEARVTHGPSCRPGGLVVEVVAGTAPYSVRLATTRTPSGEDEANLPPGETVELRTGDVAYGETIDGRLEFTAQDGSGVTFVDELEEYSFTRPTKEDCDAIAAPASPASTTGAAPSPTTGGSAPRAVTAGDTVTLPGSGFLPGELVTFHLQGSGDVLARVTAGPDGTVQTEVRIPDGTASGPAMVSLFGTQSEIVTDVALQVAAAGLPATGQGTADVVPLAAAALALVATLGALFSVVGRQRGHRPPIRSV